MIGVNNIYFLGCADFLRSSSHLLSYLVLCNSDCFRSNLNPGRPDHGRCADLFPGVVGVPGASVVIFGEI